MIPAPPPPGRKKILFGHSEPSHGSVCTWEDRWRRVDVGGGGRCFALPKQRALRQQTTYRTRKTTAFPFVRRNATINEKTRNHNDPHAYQNCHITATSYFNPHILHRQCIIQQRQGENHARHEAFTRLERMSAARTPRRLLPRGAVGMPLPSRKGACMNGKIKINKIIKSTHLETKCDLTQ